jgi:hypothetical protein
MHMLAANAVRPLLGHDVGVDVFAAAAGLAIAMACVSYLRLKTRFGSSAASPPSARRLATAQPVRT